MSPSRVNSSLVLWRSQLPKVDPFYAVKCNPEPLLLNTLYDAGTGFDCASERELLAVRELARDSGSLSEKVVYANPCKSRRDLAAASEMGAPTTVVDSVEELEKLEGYGGGALVRVAVDDAASTMPFSTKFGCQLEDVGRIADAARRRQVSLYGISFHVGSGCSDGSAYESAIARAYSNVLKLRERGHEAARIVDLGGGYLTDEADFRRKALHIRGKIDEINGFEKDIKGPGLRWIAEPGRFFAAGAFDFFVQVIGKKGGGGSGAGAPGAPAKYTLDDSLYGQFSSILFDYAAPSWVRIRGAGEKERRRGAGVLFGRTCDSVDVIARAESMEELEVGDWLWFPAMGAYTRATASEFNGFPTPTVFVDNGLPPPDLKGAEFNWALPRGITRMPPVSARAFWAAGPALGKN